MAARYWVNGGNGNWNSTTNWSATSGGSSGASVPTSADDVFLDANGDSNSTISAAITVRSLTIDSGYTSTMTHNAVLTLVGNWNFSGTYTIAGSSAIAILASSTITAGQSWPNNITLNNTTVTLASNFTVLGTLTTTNNQVNINHTTSETLTIHNGITVNINTSGGNAKIILKGGIWSGSNTIGIGNPIDMDGNITVSGSVYYRGNLTYVSGTITTTGSTLFINSTATLNTASVNWNNVTINTTGVITLTSNLNIGGNFTAVSQNITVNKNTSEVVNVSNGITASQSISGTADIYLKGGTWTGGTGGAGVTVGITSNLYLDGNITLSNNVYYRTGTLTYLSGTIDTTTNNSTLNLTGSCTINTDGITWYNVSTTNTTLQTYTINSLLTINNVFTIGGNGTSMTFNGSHGWVAATLLKTDISSSTISLKEFITYTITTSFLCFSSRTGSIVLFTSSHGTNRANLVMVNPSLCNVLASFTRIDASGGRTINTFNGTVTDCVNIRAFNDLATVGHP
jgi:hypothetical protein